MAAPWSPSTATTGLAAGRATASVPATSSPVSSARSTGPFRPSTTKRYSGATPSPAATAERLHRHGVSDVIVKNGAEGALLSLDGERTNVPVPAAIDPVDTTAAGDSFNAGFIAARLRGTNGEDAALLGHRLAAVVIRNRGAIVPSLATEGLVLDALPPMQP